MEQPNNNSPCAPLLSSIPMTFLVFHFDTISCSIEFHFQIHSSTFENSHSRLIDSIKVLFSFFYGFFKSESKHNETLSMLSERRAGELRTVGESFCLWLCGNLWSEIFDVHKQGLPGGCEGSFFKFCEMCFTSSTFGRIMKPPLSPSISPPASIHRFCSSLVCYRSNFFYYRNYKSETVDCSFHTIWYICSTTSSRRPLFKNFDLANCAFVEGRWEKKVVWH